jgi:hypothetical protein
MGLQGFERRLERLFEGVFAKAFRSGLEPVELGRRLVRQMDRDRKVGVSGRKVAPNHFTFELHPDDLAQLSSSMEPLCRELEEAARDHAREERYQLLGRIHVEIVEAKKVGTGTFDLVSEIRAAPGGRPVGSLVLVDGRRVPLGDRAVTIGRLDTCDIVLDDPTVSRTHAEVRRDGDGDGDGFEVVDLQSRNGTRVNGFGIARHRLADGDEVHIGAVPLRFEAV